MKKITYILFTVLLLFTVGCKKSFFDINQNPNSPTEESITPQILLPNILHQTAKKMAISYDFTAHWMGYWARSGTFGPSNPLENFNITTTYEKDEWVNGSNAEPDPTVSWYNILKDNDVMEKKALANGQTYYVAIAKIIKSIGYMYLVDCYNNVPYSESFKGADILTPKYDNGQDIYNDLILQLNEAVIILKNVDAANTTGIAQADIMFKGNALKWRKLANTQHLKLLIRQSQIPGFTPTSEIAKINADGSGFIMQGETASVNPGYSGAQFQQNPFYNAYLKDFNGGLIDNFNRANNYVLFKLEDNNDIRYEYYFSKAETPLGGNIYFGYDFGFVDPNPNNPKAVNSSNVAGPGLAKSPSQNQWLFTSVESMFLQAEATKRGWLSGSAQAKYEAAVKESFNWLGVVDASTEASNYLANAGLYQDNLNFIVTQKYLSLVGVNNFEAWVDYRRLGVPTDLPASLSPSLNGRSIPLRLLYPQEEYSYNSDNVNAQGTINAQTSKIFWDK